MPVDLLTYLLAESHRYPELEHHKDHAFVVAAILIALIVIAKFGVHLF